MAALTQQVVIQQKQNERKFFLMFINTLFKAVDKKVETHLFH